MSRSQAVSQQEMAKESRILVAFLLLFLLGKSSAREVMVKTACNDKVGGCLLEDGEEVEMSSEDNRRLLWAATERKYISYEALKGDFVPCNKPGVPYYNCHSFQRSNPYQRGCQIISGCRGDGP